MQQRVQQPTRGPYLLDLVLSDLGKALTTTVLSGVSDHKMVITNIKLPVPVDVEIPRFCFDYKKASWKHLDKALDSVKWLELFNGLDVHAAADAFAKTVLDAAKKYIPSRNMKTVKSTHPWLNDECRRLVSAKLAAVGTLEFADRQAECSRGMVSAYYEYVSKTNERLKNLPRSSKSWRKLCQSVLMSRPATSSVPPLVDDTGQWYTTPLAKATLLSRTFGNKSKLPSVVVNQFSELGGSCGSQMSGFLPVRQRATLKVLQALSAESGTGPDGISARVLKQCSRSLAYPITLLARRILQLGQWPRSWTVHWIFPLHKRNAKSKPANYRGIHLTVQISKVVERLLGKLCQPYVEVTTAFGPNQFAYCRARGYKDVLALNVMSWIMHLNNGMRVAVYCSDVSGAFDRVSSTRLLAKLKQKGVHPQIVSVLESWLDEREAYVIVDGVSSERSLLRDSVFQGTVLGPCLWNCFYEDARLAIRAHGFLEYVFADDLMAFKPFDTNLPDAVVLSRLEGCQAELHAWGLANQVVFDADKEGFHILHRRHPWGNNFKSLGVTFDTKLVMRDACFEVAAQGHTRINTLLRTRRFHSDSSLVDLYKSHVLSFLESSTPAIFHAPRFFLAVVDQVQARFLDALGLTPDDALFHFNLAPLCSRRDVAMLGLIHRIVLGLAPPQFSDFIRPPRGYVDCPRAWRASSLRHSKQLHDPIDGSNTATMGRSVFGLIYSYNLLPQGVVNAPNVKMFQRSLQRGLKSASKLGVRDRELLLSSGVRTMSVESFHYFFSKG